MRYKYTHTHSSKNHRRWYFYRIHSNTFCTAVLKEFFLMSVPCDKTMKRNQSSVLKSREKKNKIVYLINSHPQHQLPNERGLLSCAEGSWLSCSEDVISHCSAFPQILVHLFSSYNESDTGRLMTWNPADKMKLLSSSCWHDHSNAMWKIRRERKRACQMEIQFMMHFNQQGLHFTG